MVCFWRVEVRNGGRDLEMMRGVGDIEGKRWSWVRWGGAVRRFRNLAAEAAARLDAMVEWWSCKEVKESFGCDVQ
jgi:hypothetical protein